LPCDDNHQHQIQFDSSSYLSIGPNGGSRVKTTMRWHGRINQFLLQPLTWQAYSNRAAAFWRLHCSSSNRSSCIAAFSGIPCHS
jgi:hypothetical protein